MDTVLNVVGSGLCFIALCMLLMAYMKKHSKREDRDGR